MKQKRMKKLIKIVMEIILVINIKTKIEIGNENLSGHMEKKTKQKIMALRNQ